MKFYKLKKSHSFGTVVSIFLLIVFNSSLFSQGTSPEIIRYDGGDLTPIISDPNITVSDITFGPGVAHEPCTGFKAMSGVNQGDSLSALINGDYFQFTVTPNPGYEMTLDYIRENEYASKHIFVPNTTLGSMYYQIGSGTWRNANQASRLYELPNNFCSQLSWDNHYPYFSETSTEPITFRFVRWIYGGNPNNDVRSVRVQKLWLEGFTQLACGITGPAAVCNNTNGFAYSAPPDMAAYEWTISGNGTINGANDQQTVTVDAGASGNYTLSLEMTASGGDVESCQLVVTVETDPTISNAGPDQFLNTTFTNLAGNNPSSGTGEWSLVSGSGNIASPTNRLSAVTGLGVGVNTFRWTITKDPCPASIDEVNITYTPCMDNDSDGYNDISCGGTDCNDADPAIHPLTVWYKDADGDGYSDGNTQTQCAQPTGYELATNLTATSGDCNDSDPVINPATIWYKDADGDGFSDGASQTQCTQPADYYLAADLTATSGDCNDSDPEINPNTLWYKDTDGDGYSDGTTQAQCTQPAGYELPANLTATSGDCNDDDASINPLTLWYKDADGDGYSEGTTQTQCAQPVGFDLASNLTSTSGDCNDDDPEIHPATVWYKDADADGYSDGARFTNCLNPPGYYLATSLTSTSGDCNDLNPMIHPATIWYKDVDGDGYSDGNTQTQCAQPSGYDLATNLTATSGDCNDSDPAIYPATVWYKDNDNDGYSDGMTQTQCAQPAGYELASNLTATSGDCDDNNHAIHPATVWYKDGDGDGYSDGTMFVNCSSPPGYFLSTALNATSGDCNDNDAAIHPNATETCNGIDDDCANGPDDGLTFNNYYVDGDGDGYGAGAAVTACESPGADYVLQNGDCNDSDAFVNPGATEVCNGIDDDCANGTDDGLTFNDYYVDVDGDGYGAGAAVTACASPGAGYVLQNGDCDDGNAAIHPGASEICNGIDDDCVNGPDDGLTFNDYYVDGDGDGYGAGAPVAACESPGAGYVLQDGDCNDSDAFVNPGVTEVCNGIDDDCANGPDDGLTFNDYYVDVDGDGYGAGAAISACASPGTGYVLQNGDCNDSDALVNPGATEVCNGLDDDCANGPDDGLTFNDYYVDGDGDGYGAGAATSACASPGAGYVLQNGDCDDGNAAVHPSASEICNGVDDDCANGPDDGLTFNNYYVDGDGDGYGAGAATSACASPGAGYVLQNGDCDDGNAAVHPGATEVCNGLDDDCANGPDDGLTFNDYYVDDDGDGYGAGAAISACASPGAGYVLQNGDCNDSDASIHPGATEICNGIDDDCVNGPDDSLTFNDYYVDGDGDGYGAGAATSACESPGAGYALQNGDCDDGNAAIYPGASEVCNGIDDDCANGPDDGLAFNDYYVDVDGDGYGAGAAISACASPGTGYVLQNGDCNDSDALVNPGATEVCNGLDDDCANGPDDGLAFNDYYVDGDGDGYGAGAAVTACESPGAGYVLQSGDCNDSDASIHPGATEICNGLDDDCANGVDDGIIYSDWYYDSDGDGYGAGSATNACASPGAGYVLQNGDCDDGNAAVHPGATEVCNGLDDDCANGPDDGLTFNHYYVDGDGDGYGAGAAVTACESPGAGYVLQSGDCNDSDASVHPGASEVCNGIDDDCANGPDDGLTFNDYYVDGDGDGYGAGAAVTACDSPGSGYVLQNGDCNDSDAAVHPGATEICDGIDNNCSNLIDTNDPMLVDVDPPTVICHNIAIVLNSQGNASITPNYVFQNGFDNCGSVNLISVLPNSFTCANEGANLVTLTVDDGHGNTNFCNATVIVTPFLTDPVVSKTNETCQGMSNGTLNITALAGGGQVKYSIDGGTSFANSGYFTNLSPGTYNIVVKVFGIANICTKTAIATINAGASSSTWYQDMDGDGFTNGTTYVGCNPPVNYVANALIGDCDDNDPLEYPGQSWWKDSDNDGFTNGTTTIACQRPVGYKLLAELSSSDIDCNDANTAIYPNATEICDGVDNDCDTAIDEGISGETYVGNIIFSSQAQVDDWPACYSVIQGNVVIQGAYLTDLGSLSNIQEITGNLMIVLNSHLTSLNGLDNLTAVGGSLYMYYNFLLNNCCAIESLLSSGGVTGPVVIFFNQVGCNSATEISTLCGTQNLVAGPNQSTVVQTNSAFFQATQETETLNLKVFPNPAVHRATVEFEGEATSGTMMVRDVNGQVVAKQRFKEGTSRMQIDLTGWQSGAYFVQIKLDDGRTLLQRMAVIGSGNEVYIKP